MNYEQRFTAKSKKFRLHFRLTEEEIDLLLENKNLKYKGLEIGSRTLTLDLAEAYPLIFGLDYCEFKNDNITFPSWDNLPQSTKDFIEGRPDTARNKIGLSGTKHKASYIVIAIRDFAIGHTFSNSDIILNLPSPLDKESSIDWNKGLLKGLVKNTTTSRTYKDENGDNKRETIYKVIKAVDDDLLKKANKNIGEDKAKKNIGEDKAKKNI
ncbi:hypothetical protein [Sphingobacterium sp. IITKGP-BTPF85]|uniref:hypothetical protein n=1 Tax=Sphingobacterium sp. IITKGP-BTPF85 TaxID=1338009 RepID=UPI00038A473D|nr:hypothetical protein [Sphingobacterium sp. IITKGP-BTPF85]KKX51798.1 hypothetical protein L950_0203175 [Sphingobacterium sp. IITKGP-BTPF85]